MNYQKLARVLSLAIEQQQFDRALEQVKNMRPVDIADILAEINPSLAWQLLDKMPDSSGIFSYLDADIQIALTREFPRANLARLVSEMPSDERADLYNHLDQGQKDALLPALAQAEREDIRKLAAYREGTAGALMTSDYATLDGNMNVSEALAALRTEAPDAETIYHAYVIDAGRKLQGVVSLRALILAAPTTLMHSLMVSSPIHMMSPVPAVIVMTMSRIAYQASLLRS